MMNEPNGNYIPRWGMAIDLNRCVGCQTCTAACKHANDTPPEVQWRRVIDVEQGTFPDVERLFMVVGCQHCEEPPCVPVCPTGATRQRADGLVTMDYDQCIGCAYCAVSCPYQARTIMHEERGYFGSKRTEQELATAHPERRGVAQKCTFCIDRVDAGLAQGLVPGVDPAASPACAAACIASAIHFGDYNDPQSNVSRLTAAGENFQMHEELGTHPQIRYLYTHPAVPGRAAKPADEDDARQSDLANPLVGPLQRFWDWRAAMNWCFGGAGSGLAVMAWLAAWIGILPPARLPAVMALAGLLMAIGLFCVFLKIGRQLRFWRAVLRPQTSWMTRELYAVLVFYPAVFASVGCPEPGVAGVACSVAALAALAFLGCQAMILYKARGIPAWRIRRVVLLIGLSGLAEGAGVLLLLLALDPVHLASSPAVLLEPLYGLLILIVLRAIVWRDYVVHARTEGVGPLAHQVLRRLGWLMQPAAQVVSLLIAAPAFLLPSAVAAPFAAATGLIALAVGFGWKYQVIVKAGYQQGFALPRLPQRGSGHNAAPARMSAPARAS